MVKRVSKKISKKTSKKASKKTPKKATKRVVKKMAKASVKTTTVKRKTMNEKKDEHSFFKNILPICNTYPVETNWAILGTETVKSIDVSSLSLKHLHSGENFKDIAENSASVSKTTAEPKPFDDYIEKRRSARLDVPLTLTYKLANTQETRSASTKNISAGGCLMVTKEDLPLGAKLSLDINLCDSNSKKLGTTGTIIRICKQSQNMNEFGISFDDMSRNTKRVFSDYCFAKMYEMIGLSEWPTDRTQTADHRLQTTD